MHQVEQLRNKRTEAQKHLLSRKRKLSQLYSVTAYTGDRFDSSISQLYFQQLQSFQDANDLEKGRFFNDSTLPPRTRITRSQRIVSTQPTEGSVLYPTKDLRRPKSPSKPDSLLSPNPIEVNISSQSQSRTLNGADSGQSMLNGEEKTQVRVPKRRQSPAVIPPGTFVEPQSSPASTNGAVSSNTPIPDAISPDTSPGGEVVSNKKADNSDVPEVETTRPRHTLSVSSLDVDIIDTDPTAAFDSPIQSHSPIIKKPSIRVNTQTNDSYFQPRDEGLVETPVAMTAATPKQTPLPTPLDSARRATRISSGALQKKSVSEILGETPRSASPYPDSPSAIARTAEKERKERERSKLSTVVFAKPQRPIIEDTIEIAKVDVDTSENKKERDYLYTLFESKAFSVNRQGSLSYLLQHSHKTLSTADHLVDYEYQAQCRVLKRLYQLQSADRWALRQRRRVEEPARPTSHWDFLLDHAKWMRTDFREERRWKIAAAKAVAESCAEWVAANSEEKKLLQIRVRSKDIEMEDGPGPTLSSHPTPELVAAGEDDSVSDDLADPTDLSLSMAPAAIFSLGASDFMFAADKTPAFEKLINELPLYEPVQIEPDLSKSNLAERRDARWKTDLVSVSRYATEKIKINEVHPPLKRSRYDYEIENSPPNKRIDLPARDTNVALFMSENKHIRDRIHPGHSFRPPSEHPMPAQQFFENRSSSQWTANEDDELKKLVKDYSYNWSLISGCLSPRSLYTAGHDRRTPWECFERWIGLEGMPADMSKTPYFKTYSGRIEAATRHIQAQIEEAQRRAGANVPISIRKRTTQPVRVERKRAQRHLAMLDAMRKLAKKKEAVRQKAIHSADMAAMRKSNEVNQPRLGTKTPAEWSQIKFEREMKMAKQQELYRQQLIAHQRAATQQRVQNPPPTQIPVPTQPNRGQPQNGTPVPGMPNGHLQVPNGHPRPQVGVPNGMNLPTNMGPKGIPNQMQAGRGMQGSPQQIKMHQEQLIRQAQQHHSSPNVPNATMANGQGVNNPAFLAAMAQANGQPASPGVHNSSSPRPQSSHMGQALSSGHIPAIGQLKATIKERHPNMTEDEITRLATQQLTAWQQQATAAAAGQTRPKVNQAALNAAMGAANAAIHAGNVAAAAAAAQQNGGFNQGMMTNEQVQQYNQRMRMQQAQQHAVRGMQAPMPMGMTNSPSIGMARPTSQHGQVSRSATPRDQRSGSVSSMTTAAVPNGNQVPTPQPNAQGSPRVGQQVMQT